MNKIFLLTAAFAVMASLSGCSDTELASIDTAQEKTPIGFHTVGSQMGSRATIINSGDITKTDFKVYAFDGKGNAFMGKKDADGDLMNHNGVHIMYDKTTSAWIYKNSSDLRYWPDYSLNFYAVSPATFSSELLLGWKIDNESPTIYYSLSDEYANTSNPANVDVMYAVAKGQKKTDGGKLNLDFKHILSQIAFQAKTNDQNLVVEINEIKLFNMKYSGYFDIPTENTPNWRPNELLSGGHAFTVITGANITVNSTTDATDISSENKPMLVIPQQLKAWQTNTTTAKTKGDADNDKEGYLGIGCKIKVNGEDYKIGNENENASGYGYIYVPFGDTWEPGKRYLYTLIFGGGYTDKGKPFLTPINFTASTEEWKDGNNSTNGEEIPLYQEQ